MTQPMSVQNQILQSLHSAWVDELGEKFPDQKIELGLPKRFPGWGTLESTTQTLIAPLQAGDTQGFAAWGFKESQKTAEIKKMAESCLQRCAVHIKIHHQLVIKTSSVEVFNSHEHHPACTIWFPITIQMKGNGLVFDLGVAF